MAETDNPQLALLIAATGSPHAEIARRLVARAQAEGHRQVAPGVTRIRRWIEGERPRPPVPNLLAAVLSEALGQALTPGDLGLNGTGPELDSIQLPMLTEAAARLVAGWAQLDLLINRRDTLKLALGAPLIVAAQRMLTGRPRALSQRRKGFDEDTATALEEVTAFFAAADAAKGGGLHRPAIIAQLAEVARRIQDGVPANCARVSSPRLPISRRWPGGSATTRAATRRLSGTGATASTPPGRPGSLTAAWRSSPACPTR
ncbi:hypothetical protein [Streptomyces buecherae]|uniref:hypothetical protein n=1 Tax=Streptomyces buecherae TaxID=2763006 RepID=UPI001E56CFEE|nr:hypothetical protein [Streptomyces buecherae]